MKLEQQVVSLELAKQLKKAGYPQEGLWWWNQDTAYKRPHITRKPTGYWAEFNITKHNMIVAPTVAELGKELPPYYISYFREIEQKWCCGNLEDFSQLTIADTEGNAKAKMWLYLKKENLL